MGESVFTRRSVVKNEYIKLADITVSGSAVTSVDITGLNIGKDEEVVLVGTYINGSAGAERYLQLFINNNNTTTNYYRQELRADSTSVSAYRANQGISITNTGGSGSTSYFSVTIKPTNNGYFVTQSDTILDVGLSTMRTSEISETSTFTISSISNLTLSDFIGVTSIGIGSRFQLYRSGA